MKNYIHPPILTGNELTRDQVFGSKDASREIPIRSMPLWNRRQELQERNDCTIQAVAEAWENKIYKDTGVWWYFPPEEIHRIWTKMKAMGLAGEEWGAYSNAPFKALEDDEIVTLENKVSMKKLRTKLNSWFTVANRSDSVEEYASSVLFEIAYGGSVITGINTTVARLDYFGADEPPYIVQDKENPEPLAHQVTLTGFDYEKDFELIKSSGTWGERFGDRGVVNFQEKHLRRLFTTLGFTITILD